MIGGRIWSGLRIKIIMATVFLGPSMMIALQMSGKSFQRYLDIKADYGLSLIIVALMILGFKLAFVDGLARYTLYRKDSVFSILPSIPGPKNWAVWAVATIYILEMALYYNLALEAGSSLTGLFSWSFPIEVLAFVIVSVILVFLLLRSRPILEKVVYSIIGVTTVLLLYCAVALLTSPGRSLGQDLFVSLPLDAVCLAGSGSGLSLLLYSIWLSDKAKNVNSGDDFRTELSKVRWSIGFSFLITGVITTLVLIIGRIYSEEMSSTVASIILLCTAVLMSGMVMVGMDGRARAIGKMLRQTGVLKIRKEQSYGVLVLLFFFIITIGLMIGTPFGGLALVSAVSSAMFALSGFALVYIDRNLPSYAKGGPLWASAACAGSAFFLAVALLEEETLLNFGAPLMIWMGLIGILLYCMWRVNFLTWLIMNSRNLRGGSAIIAIFSAVAVFGTATGISHGGLVINFRDLGAMMAGLLGGPIVGTVVGFIGGAYRYGIGGWTALSCFAATVFAGLFSGLMINRWKGEISYLKVSVLGLFVESVHIFFLLPLLQQGGTTEMVWETTRDIFLPMAVTNIIGLNIYAYIIEKRKETTHR